MSLRVLIAGGGLGGLTAAIALRRAGLDVLVFEKAPELREIGSGLSVWPNATRALDRLGLLEPVLAVSHELRLLQLRTSRGRVISRAAVDRGEHPSVCVHRAELLSVLKERVPGECVRVSHELETFEDNGSRVTAHFTGGVAAEGDALVGADGVRSRARAILLGDREPVYRGYHAWRGVAPCAHPEHDRSAAIEFWGRGRRFGMEPMTQSRTFWYATRNAPAGSLGESSSWKDEVREAFRGWASPVPDVIEATPPEAIVKHPIEDRPVRRRFGSGRVTLLGDAAHLTTPNLGQGACLAVEDAVVLAGCLVAAGDVPQALRRYESGRYRRARYIVAESRRIGWIGQLEGLLSVAVRDAALRALPQRLNEGAHRRYFAFAC